MMNASYKNHINTYDLLKVVALLTMVIDHVGMFLCPDATWLRAIGRMAFPLFLFLVGYSHQFKVKSDIIIGCLLVVALDAWTFYPIFAVNILGTIIAVRLLMAWLVRRHWFHMPMFQHYAILLIWFLPTLFMLEYGSVAMMYAFIGYYARVKETPRLDLLFMLAFTTVFHITMQIWIFEFGTFDAVISAITITIAGACMLMHPLKEHVVGDTAKRAINLLSRHTLLIYVAHVAIFQIIETWLHPGPASGNPWLQLAGS